MSLHPSALRAVAEMFDSSRRTDIGTFFVSSGFRGYEAQAELYGDGSNSAFVLPPGHSEHHTGLAADIMAVGIGQWELGDSAQGGWLAENAHRYGLILRYPKGAERITGIEYEPWHFRYVGKAHAYYMFQNGLVLEEYLQLVRSRGSFLIEMRGAAYAVIFQTAQNGKIDLPDNADFTVSSDNTGGYIITAAMR